MIPTKRLLYKIDLKLNKVASGKNQRVSNSAKILALREASLRVFKKKVSVNNLFQLGFDAFKPRYEELQSFVVSHEELSPVKSNEVYTAYEVSLQNLSHKYFMAVDLQAIASRDGCTDRIINIPRVIKHGEVNTTINNLHYGPSFKFQETIAKISDNKLIVYTNDPDGDFVLTKVLVSYLRYPVEVDIAGMKHVDGSASSDVDSDFPEMLEDELLEQTIFELGINTGNINAADGAIKKSKESEL